MVQPRPTVPLASPWQFPAATEHRLGNGIRVLLYNRPGQHITSTRLLVPTPLAVEPRELEGVATMVARTMDEGTGSHTADEMAELFELSGIAYGAGYGARGLTLETDATASRAAQGWALVTECLSEPAFPEQEVTRHVRQRLSEIEHEAASPEARATKEWAATFYDQRSRAARPAGGTTETVARITPEDCARFHAQWVRPDDATVVIAGELDEAQALRDLDATLGTWRVDGVAPQDDSPVAIVAGGPARVRFVHRPGAVQTELYLGSFGPDRTVDGGWAPYPVLGFAVGGSPNARLDAVLREEKGYTYGFRAGFRPRDVGGTFIVSGSVRSDVTVEATRLTLEILQDASKGFTDEETRAATDYIGKTAPARYATADAVADEALVLESVGLGTEFVSSYLSQLAALTAGDLDAAWAKWADEPRTVVLVGDAEAHADGIRALGIGDVEVV
ncbi:M16 family metallopeptidase [Flexivirga oryzae]|uniref:Putative Zn-dependent peptidase n=1 Tax=Flexivirga oryzae TaxID=1794944 RepID=A0A839MZQ2_9MICO|nr:pitrilysin family protein [Flexivirga oryzae]MBB2890069.1 putative Zn-dependent peptidase [Flexivirga oryzae]